METICHEINEHRNILILGFGKEGQSTYRFIRSFLPDRILTIADQATDLTDNKLLENDSNIKLKLGANYLNDLLDYDWIIKSPGISLKHHPEIAQNKCLTSQTDLFLQYFHRQTIGVTGTKGKSTVSTLIYHILRKQFDDILLLGNIGIPAFDCLEKITSRTIIVYELSCHQLEFIRRSPYISILLNIYEEHLDYYSSYHHYQQVKFNIIKFQDDQDTIIFNIDNEIIRKFIGNFAGSRNKIALNSDEPLQDGFYMKNNRIFISNKTHSTVLFYDGTERKTLLGDHNLFNMMVTAAVCKLLSVSDVKIIEGFNDFKTLPHRLEYIGNVGGIDFYNDSISTVVESTIAALNALQNVDTLILGGFDRGIHYDHLVSFICQYPIRNVILVGHAGQRIYKSLKEASSDHIQCYLSNDYQDIVDIAFQVTRPQTICLLSPAAPSYDLFKNFEERGERFKYLICQRANQQKYDQYRKEYPIFIYENYMYEIKDDDLFVEYSFNISHRYEFRPKLKIIYKSFYNYQDVSKDQYDNLIFHIGMVELISYWKTTCSPKIYIKPHFLSQKQIDWWKKFYFHGLGEFFHRNSIFDVNLDNFMIIETNAENPCISRTNDEFNNAVLIPIGGGKDSIVTLELLKDYVGMKIPLVMNLRQTQSQVLELAGYARDQIVEIERILDPELFQMNVKGFLNGHTPFSGLLAFLTLLIGAITKCKHIALSNESSANEPTVKSSSINHQYSKSFEFEKDFRSYVNQYISSNLNYFSFLRPVNELQISQLFSKQEKYFQVFKSCNVYSKQDLWCCNCPKCLFTFIILSPFIQPHQLELIFGENLLKKSAFEFQYQQLIGTTNQKPFECVGTSDEVLLALSLSLKYYPDEKPYLLYLFEQKHFDQTKSNIIFSENQFTNEHFLSDEFQHLLRSHISK